MDSTWWPSLIPGPRRSGRCIRAEDPIDIRREIGVHVVGDFTPIPSCADESIKRTDVEIEKQLSACYSYTRFKIKMSAPQSRSLIALSLGQALAGD